jgi:hypothetical protein
MVVQPITYYGFRLNLYVYEYMRKRKWDKAADQFSLEAGVQKDAKTPKESDEGLLYEYVLCSVCPDS